MKVLITNDDGIRGPGLKALVDARPADAEVWVVAPDRERSATSQAITMHKPLRVERTELAPGVHAFHLNGTPSDCVKVGIELMEQPPAVLLSGINRGPNLGTDVVYSGTVSGAIEAAVYDLPAIALSLDDHDAADPRVYKDAAEVGWHLARQLVQHGLPKGSLLNVNVPGAGPLQGVRVTRLGMRRYKNVLHKREDPRGREYYWLAGDVSDIDVDDEMTDTGAVRDGYVSVTPMQFDLTKYSVMDEVQRWNLDGAVANGGEDGDA